jgi:hypothetical protein
LNIATFDTLEAFLVWWLKSKPLKPPFTNDMLMIDGMANGAVLYRDGPFQVQLFIIQPHTEIVEHTHPNMDSYEVYLGGDIEFSHSGKKQTEIETLRDVDGVCSEYGKVIRVKPNDIHGGKFGDKGGLFLSVQHWINGASPTSANIEWRFADENKTDRYEALKK